MKSALALVVLCGCSSLLLNVTSVDLTIDFSTWSAAQRSAVTGLAITISGAQSGSKNIAVGGVQMQERIELRPNEAASGTLHIAVAANDSAGAQVGQGFVDAQLSTGGPVAQTLSMTAAAAAADMGIAPAHGDMAASPVSSDMAGSCTLVPQGGCPSGNKCVYTLGQANCIPFGTTAPGQLCNADTCVKGVQCDNPFGPPTLCRQLCVSDSDCTQAPPSNEPTNSGLCVIGVATSQGTKLCSIPCDPVPSHTSGCASGLACHVFANSGTNGEDTDCGTAGTAEDGESCTTNLDCVTGFTCVESGGGPSHCRPVCRINTNSDCTVNGESCVSITGRVRFGACCPGAGC